MAVDGHHHYCHHSQYSWTVEIVGFDSTTGMHASVRQLLTADQELLAAVPDQHTIHSM